MEKNEFETIEEVEQDLKPENVEGPRELLEYEKLLLAERNRIDYEHATTLIKCGCFKEYEDNNFDFSNLELIETKKLYKGVYNLYRNLDTMHLYFVRKLVEDNKGDAEAERKDLKPYAHYIIEIEYMDNETYNMVIKAARNNLGNMVSRFYVGTIVAYILCAVIAVYFLIYNLIANSESDFASNLVSTLYYSYPYLVCLMVLTPLLGIFTIFNKKFKKEH